MAVINISYVLILHITNVLDTKLGKLKKKFDLFLNSINYMGS